MDREATIDAWCIRNQKFFDPQDFLIIREHIDTASDAQIQALLGVDVKDTTIMLIVSFIAGYLGVDWFLYGRVGRGIAKLLLCWATLYIWWLYDLIMSKRHTFDHNFEQVAQVLNIPLDLVE